VLPISLPAVPKPGRPDAANANAVIQSIERAAALCLSGETSGIDVLAAVDACAKGVLGKPLPRGLQVTDLRRLQPVPLQG